jgi:hypothetical protein
MLKCYFTAIPVAPSGNPETVCRYSRPPSCSVEKTLIVSFPELSTYKNLELMLNAASIGEVPAPVTDFVLVKIFKYCVDDIISVTANLFP